MLLYSFSVPRLIICSSPKTGLLFSFLEFVFGGFDYDIWVSSFFGFDGSSLFKVLSLLLNFVGLCFALTWEPIL